MPKDKTEKTKSTQSFLRLSEIKSDTMIMDDGTYCAVVAVSSTNFALKSQEEQNALVAGYQSFLNSLDFEIQILMQSRKMEISSYIEKLKILMEQQTNELLRVQTAEYIEFISKLIESASIMNKNFYIVIPYVPAVLDNASSAAKSPGGIMSLFKRNNVQAQAAELAAKAKDFQEHRMKLDQHVNTVIAGLSGLGLKSQPLRTEEIIELIYASYNLDSGPLIDASKLSEIRIKN